MKQPLPAVLLVVVGFLAMVMAGQKPGVLAQEKKSKEVAGKADVLRHVPKKFATLVDVDVDVRRVTLHLDGEPSKQTWSVNPDAELKIHGWWGRLRQFVRGDRVWVWFAIDRSKKPKSVLMLADEISQQDIHGLPETLKSVDEQNGTVTLASKANGERTLKLAGSAGDVSGQVGKPVYVQSAGKTARTLAGEAQLEELRKQQQVWLRQRWREDGLPGTVVFLHPLGGEMDVMLDHEAIRWGRYLKRGDAVTFPGGTPILATVKEVNPWRERTQLRLVSNSGVDQADLSIGQRIQLRVPEPPQAIQASGLPTDIGRRETKARRIEWFLASVYCPCKVAGDRCTGMFYTLSSCNVNACGMPNQIRGKVAEMIDSGMTDQQIWDALQELRGPQITKQHLLR